MFRRYADGNVVVAGFVGSGDGMSRRIMFVGLSTGTLESCDSSARVVDLDARQWEPDGDDYVDDIEILNLAESDGIPVSELIAAYEWRESLRGAGILDEIEDHVVRCYQNMGVEV
jgi:hypothetical protein